MDDRLMRLACTCTNYEWGKVGNDSLPARFAALDNPNMTVDPHKPYAELWMGTHASHPSKDFRTGRSLRECVQADQALLHSSVVNKYGLQMPFLFKVLSIDKALSIQAHPNKKLAGQLHIKDPDNYPDDNHKPEMTIAITPFAGFCGFRPLEEIAHFLKVIPSLRRLVGNDRANAFESAIQLSRSGQENANGFEEKIALQALFSDLLKTEPGLVASATVELIKQAWNEEAFFALRGSPSEEGSKLASVVRCLGEQYPGDIGLFVTFFLNYVELEVGEAMFLQADDIHAYISGDVIECMATSDNVVRAGFTPKFKDVSTLTTMLTYSYGPVSEQKLVPTLYEGAKLNVEAESSSSTCVLYDPPIEEFSVVKCELNKIGARAGFALIYGPSIIICTSGSGTISIDGKSEAIHGGHVFFVGAEIEYWLESMSDKFVVFKAFCEIAS